MDIRMEASQSLPDLRRAPVRLIPLGPHDQRLDLVRKLIGMAIGPSRAIGEALKPGLVVAGEDLVAGLARNPGLSAQACHLFAIQKPGNELSRLSMGLHTFQGIALPAKGPIV